MGDIQRFPAWQVIDDYIEQEGAKYGRLLQRIEVIFVKVVLCLAIAVNSR